MHEGGGSRSPRTLAWLPQLSPVVLTEFNPIPFSQHPWAMDSRCQQSWLNASEPENCLCHGHRATAVGDLTEFFVTAIDKARLCGMGGQAPSCRLRRALMGLLSSNKLFAQSPGDTSKAADDLRSLDLEDRLVLA